MGIAKLSPPYDILSLTIDLQTNRGVILIESLQEYLEINQYFEFKDFSSNIGDDLIKNHKGSSVCTVRLDNFQLLLEERVRNL